MGIWVGDQRRPRLGGLEARSDCPSRVAVDAYLGTNYAGSRRHRELRLDETRSGGDQVTLRRRRCLSKASSCSALLWVRVRVQVRLAREAEAREILS